MRYHNFSISLHWFMVVLMILLFVGGWYMGDLPKGSSERTWFFVQHKSLGLTAALLAGVRLIWLFMTPAPPLPDSLSRLQVRFTRIGHALLYVFMFLQPISGYLTSAFSGYKTQFWGIALPHWGWKDPALNTFFSGAHELFSYCLLVLVGGHVGAVLLHLWRRESVFGRMWPGSGEAQYRRPAKGAGG